MQSADLLSEVSGQCSLLTLERTPVLPADPQKPGKAQWHVSLADERRDLAQQWIRERNGDLAPESVPAGSTFRAAWQCGKRCEHCRKAT